MFTAKMCYLYELKNSHDELVAKGTTNQIAGYLDKSSSTIRTAISRKEIIDGKYSVRR